MYYIPYITHIWHTNEHQLFRLQAICSLQILTTQNIANIGIRLCVYGEPDVAYYGHSWFVSEHSSVSEHWHLHFVVCWMITRKYTIANGEITRSNIKNITVHRALYHFSAMLNTGINFEFWPNQYLKINILSMGIKVNRLTFIKYNFLTMPTFYIIWPWLFEHKLHFISLSIDKYKLKFFVSCFKFICFIG